MLVELLFAFGLLFLAVLVAHELGVFKKSNSKENDSNEKS